MAMHHELAEFMVIAVLPRQFEPDLVAIRECGGGLRVIAED